MRVFDFFHSFIDRFIIIGLDLTIVHIIEI